MEKRRLTCRRYFDKYKPNDLTNAVLLNNMGFEGEVDNVMIAETDETIYEDGHCRITRTQLGRHYLVGEVANRLYDYEQLGYSPKELKEIIDDRKKLKERLNSIHGASAFDVNVESLYPRIFIENIGRRHGKTLMQAEMARDMISLKAKIATLDEINKNKSKIEYVNYYKADVENTQAMYGRISRMSGPYPWGWNIPEIDNVIFNDPATIIFWKDGTKTVVKSQEGETYDPEKGLAMAISKKALGNKREYYNVFKKWLKKYNPSSRTLVLNVGDAAKGFADGIKRASEGARSLAATLRENAARENKRNAIQALKKARYNTRATKEVLKLAMEEAIRYLEKEN